MAHPWNILRPLLDSAAAWKINPEWAHIIALKALQRAGRILPATCYSAPRQSMGLTFINPIGLAAGMDKNGVALPAWQKCGFGFVEIGTVTPRPQAGNPKPRLFRLQQSGALINRMGFNNKGMTVVAKHLKSFRRGQQASVMRVGVNLGKNKTTPLENAADDYIQLLETFWQLADYLTINISSPNTPGLRQLAEPKPLSALLTAVFRTADTLKQKTGVDTPIVLKIDPDLSSQQLQDLVDTVRQFPLRALIATNTTCQRPPPVDNDLNGQQVGGLSGVPLKPLALNVVKSLDHLLGQSDIELIGCGGIDSADAACDFLNNGAQLLQIYTGFIYRGPQLIEDLIDVC